MHIKSAGMVTGHVVSTLFQLSLKSLGFIVGTVYMFPSAGAHSSVQRCRERSRYCQHLWPGLRSHLAGVTGLSDTGSSRPECGAAAAAVPLISQGWVSGLSPLSPCSTMAPFLYSL